MSFTEFSKTVTSVPWIFGHISANASLYAVIKVLYAVAHSSPKDEIWSSKMDNAVHKLAKNVFVCTGLFMAVVTEDGFLHCCHCSHYRCRVCTEIKGRIRCFDLRTPWYLYQSNKLINRLM